MRQHLSDGGTHREHSASARVLAIGAHPADILIGAGATLLAHHADRHHIDMVTMAGDEIGEAGSAAAVQMDISPTTGGFLACNIGAGSTSVEFLERVIELTAPDVIYTHSANDHHPDHRNTHRAVLAAATAVPSIYCFEIPTTTAGFAPARYVDADEHLGTKLRLLAEHPARTACARVHPHALTGMARHWARFGAFGYAEALEVEREGLPAPSPTAVRADEHIPVMV